MKTKTACLGKLTFCPNLDKKFTGLDVWNGFAGNLDIPNIWILEM